MKKRNIIIHTHIFKNAGSSFDDALARNFGEDFIDHREDHLIHKNKDFLNAYIAENQHIRAFSSHAIYDKPTNFGNVVYHTAYFVRHPIDRIKSVYSFEHKQPAEDSLGATMAKKFDFKGYVEWRMSPEAPPTIRNMQTIFTAGVGKGHGRMEMRYEAALKMLEENPLVALVDRYDESMVIFEEYLCEFFPDIDLSYIRRNVTDKAQNLSPEEKAQKLLNDLGEELAEQVLENNKYDIELYKKANELLNEKIKYIEQFDEKLENFHQRCTQLKDEGEVKIKPLYKAIKSNLNKQIFKLLNKTGKKKKVFIQANCQGAAYKNIFNRVPRLQEKYIVLDVKPVHLWEEQDKQEILAKLKECDVFLHQPVFEVNFGFFASENLKQFLREDAISISFPNLYFTGYHPQAFYLKDEKDRKVSEPFEYHDKNIYNLFQQGKSEEEIYETIEKDDFTSLSEIEQNITTSLTELRERERYTDIAVSDYIEKNMIGKKLFHIFNHPSNEMIFHLFTKILQKIHEDKLTLDEEKLYKKELLGAIQFPVYKSVQKYFNIIVNNNLIVKNIVITPRKMIRSYYEQYKGLYFFETKNTFYTNVDQYEFINWDKIGDGKIKSIMKIIEKKRINDLLKEIQNLIVKDELALEHPINHNETFAFYSSSLSSTVNFIFFKDKNNKNPWILIQNDRFIEGLLLPQQVVVFEKSKHKVYKIIKNFLNRHDINEFFKKKGNTKLAGFVLGDKRPFHFFYDKFRVIKAFEHAVASSNKHIYEMSAISYYSTKKIYPSLEVIYRAKEGVYLIPVLAGDNSFFQNRISTDYRMLAEYMERSLYLEAMHDNMEEYPLEKVEKKLVMWIGITGQKRAWKEQIEGYVNILNKLHDENNRDVIVLIDGITATYGITTENIEDQDVYNKIKSKLNTNIKVINLIGLDYRSKIRYCNQIDFFIANAGTGCFVPLRVCKKPGVIHSNTSLFTFPDKYPSYVKIVSNENITDIVNPNSKLSMHTSYSIDWKVIYRDLQKTMKELLKENRRK